MTSIIIVIVILQTLIIIVIKFIITLLFHKQQLDEYVEDGEAYISLHQDSLRNQIISFDLMLTMTTLCVTIYSCLGKKEKKIYVYDNSDNDKYICIIS